MPKERIQKLIANAGIASRRSAEAWIREGLVKVNGQVAKLGEKADPEVDAIKVKGKLLRAQSGTPLVYFIFHKPKGVISMMTQDRSGRKTLLDYFKRMKTRLFPVGRIDFNGEGLLILTNDGEFLAKVQKKTTLNRTYRVKLSKIPDEKDLEKMKRPGRLRGKLIQPSSVRILKRYKKNAEVEISVTASGSVDMKLFLQNKGFLVEKVARTAIENLKLNQLKPGDYRPLPKKQIEKLLKFQ